MVSGRLQLPDPRCLPIRLGVSWHGTGALRAARSAGPAAETRLRQAARSTLRHCPNAECPSIERYELVAEYIDSVTHCRHCPSELADGPAPAFRSSPEWEDLIQVQSYFDVHTAYATQSALRAAGIRAFVKDEYYAGMRWDHAIALGGVRVLVPQSQVQEAEELIAGIPAQEVESIANSSEPADKRCPRCNSEDLERLVHGRVPAVLSLLLLGIPLLFRRELVRCSSCQAEYTP